MTSSAMPDNRGVTTMRASDKLKAQIDASNDAQTILAATKNSGILLKSQIKMCSTKIEMKPLSC